MEAAQGDDTVAAGDGVLSVVSWRWARKGYRSQFTAQTVNILKSMVARHYPDPHRFICCTDDPDGLDSDIEVVPLWNDHADLAHPWSSSHPSCYRRLKAFAPEMRDTFGPRFVSIDLDCVILDDLRPLWNRPEDFVGLAGTQPPTTFNGSMFLMNAGARAQVWEQFDPIKTPQEAKARGHYGSDQAIVSYILNGKEATWGPADGVYSYRIHVQPVGNRVPEGARVIFFSGKKDPWSPGVDRLDWVVRNYR
jgi:hypothetical protein